LLLLLLLLISVKLPINFLGVILDDAFCVPKSELLQKGQAGLCTGWMAFLLPVASKTKGLSCIAKL